MEKEVLENHQRYLERKKFYLGFGCDVDKERKFVLDAARPVEGRILEIGTGKGHFSLTLARAGFNVTSVDISEDEQKLARLNARYFGFDDAIDFRIGNAEQLDFPDKEFDAVFCVNTFHHLQRPFAVLDEMRRVVKPEGKIIVADFTKEGLELMDKIHKSEGGSHHVSSVTLGDIEMYLLEKGFVINRARTLFQEVLIACVQWF